MTGTQRKLIERLLSRPVAVHPIFVQIAGDLNAGVLLSQAYFWQRLNEDQGRDWWWKTREEWEAEIPCLGKHAQISARKRLRDLGLLEEEFRGVPPKLWFRLDIDRLFDLMMEVTTGSKSNEVPSVREPDGYLSGNRTDNRPGCGRTTVREPDGHPHPEMTSEMTSETPRASRAGESAPHTGEAGQVSPEGEEDPRQTEVQGSADELEVEPEVETRIIVRDANEIERVNPRLAKALRGEKDPVRKKDPMRGKKGHTTTPEGHVIRDADEEPRERKAKVPRSPKAPPNPKPEKNASFDEWSEWAANEVRARNEVLPASKWSEKHLAQYFADLMEHYMRTVRPQITKPVLGVAKDLISSAGGEYSKAAIDYLVANWDDYAREKKIKADWPMLALVRGFLDDLLNRAEGSERKVIKFSPGNRTKEERWGDEEPMSGWQL